MLRPTTHSGIFPSAGPPFSGSSPTSSRRVIASETISVMWSTHQKNESKQSTTDIKAPVSGEARVLIEMLDHL
jgi:hypothetical protein